MGEQRRRWIQGSEFLTAGMLVMAAMLPMAHAEVRLLPGAAADLDQATTSSVLKTFQQAEEALRARSVDGVMALYAEHYDYHGLHKQDMRKVWVDLLDQFQDLADVHHFSRMSKIGSGSKTIIEVTCTGSLSGLSNRRSPPFEKFRTCMTCKRSCSSMASIWACFSIRSSRK